MTGLVSQSNAQRFRKVKWPVKVRHREPVARTPSQPSRAAHFCSQEEQIHTELSFPQITSSHTGHAISNTVSSNSYKIEDKFLIWLCNCSFSFQGHYKHLHYKTAVCPTADSCGVPLLAFRGTLNQEEKGLGPLVSTPDC